MTVAVVGSIAFDSVKTPFGACEHELGGSAVHAALAAAIFTEARVIGPVGADFNSEHYRMLVERGVVTTDIEQLPDAATFTWRGSYDFDLSVANTEETRLNVFTDWHPKLSAAARKADILFLASMDPDVQIEVREQWEGEKWVAIDSIAYWIHTKREKLIKAIRGADIVLMNDQEVRALTRHPVLLHAAKEIMSWGPKAVVIKQGSYGCSLLTPEGYFALPGYPLELVADPTGAGDAFAGGFLGLLDHARTDQLNESLLRRAITYGAVVASYCVEDFGTRRVVHLSEREVTYRVADFKRMTHFEHVDAKERRLEPGGDPRRRGFEMPGPTAGTPIWGEPDHTGGTPTYENPPPTRGNPGYERPGDTPTTRPPKRPS